MSFPERIKLNLYRAIPQSLVPEDFKGKLVVNNYISSIKNNKNHGKGSKGFYLPYFETQLLRTPGTISSMYKYLNGEGSKHIPDIVGHQLGDKWYTGIAKLFARTPIGRDYVIDKILDKTLPRINGDNSLAKQYLYAGGMV